MTDKNQKIIDQAIDQEYKYGFTTDIEQTKFEPGLDEEVIKKLSKLKKEPKWLLDWRLKAFKRWKKMEEPTWALTDYESIDYQDIHYYAAPKSMEKKPESLDDIDPELKYAFDKLGIPLIEQKQINHNQILNCFYQQSH